jgi:hypothetical protein
MRLAVAMLACLGVGSIALSDTPPPTPPAAAASTLSPASPAAPESEKAPAPPEVASASAATAPPEVASASAATAPPSASAPTGESPKPAAATDPRVKQLLAKGYRPETRNGEKVYCKTEGELGSRIAAKKVCGTVDEWQSRVQDSKDAAERVQLHQLNPNN